MTDNRQVKVIILSLATISLNLIWVSYESSILTVNTVIAKFSPTTEQTTRK
jgi:hypothetical protein